MQSDYIFVAENNNFTTFQNIVLEYLEPADVEEVLDNAESPYSFKDHPSDHLSIGYKLHSKDLNRW